jgi:hypothetical protein
MNNGAVTQDPARAKRGHLDRVRGPFSTAARAFGSLDEEDDTGMDPRSGEAQICECSPPARPRRCHPHSRALLTLSQAIIPHAAPT